MNTQCPSCNTVFAVSEAQLDAHHGLVRCGKCRDIFNASWNLVDGSPADPAAAVESSPIPEDDDFPAPPREADARRAMLELLGDVDPEIERQMESEPFQRADTENEPLPPVTDLDDSEQLELEIDERVHRTPPADGARDERSHPTRDSIEIALPTGFSDDTPLERTVEQAEEPAALDDSDELELTFEDDADEPAARERAAPIELPPPPQEDADEEIIIEAPPALWGAFDDEEQAKKETAEQEAAAAAPAGEEEFLALPDEDDAKPTTTQMRRAALKPSEPRGAPVRVASGDSTTELSRSSSTLADDVRMVEIPQPRRVKTWMWVTGAVLLFLLILWQVKIFYFDDLVQMDTTRPLVSAVCAVLGCTVPPRSAPNLIQLSGTRVYQHPDVPGALQISVNLVNRATFKQILPPLEVTLTDKAGQVVGRRTYAAAEYHADQPIELGPDDERNVFIDLAQPSIAAVGYEVQLVGR